MCSANSPPWRACSTNSPRHRARSTNSRVSGRARPTARVSGRSTNSPRQRARSTNSPHQRARSTMSRATAARSCAMPAPVRAEVAIRSGKAAGRLAHRLLHGFAALGEFRLADLIAFCQHDLVADGRLAERVENAVIDLLKAVPRIDQHIDARQRGAAAQIIVDEPGPGRDLALCRGGIAVARADRPARAVAGRRKRSVPGCGPACSRSAPAPGGR